MQEASCAHQSNSTMLVQSPEDVVQTIFSFLSIADIAKVSMTCKQLNASVDSFQWDTRLIERCFRYDGINISVDNPKKLLSSMYTELKRKHIENVLMDVKDVTSQDNPSENPTNILEPSRCLQYMERLMIAGRYSERMMQNIQLACGCVYGNACYWSSAGLVDENASQHLTFEVSPVSLIYGFYVCPYQAFFHDLHPVYAPKKVKLQFLENETVYFESESFTIDRNYKRNFCCFSKPMLCVTNKVRLVLMGAYQRQTVGDLNDYYMTLSYVSILGVQISTFDCRTTADTNDVKLFVSENPELYEGIAEEEIANDIQTLHKVMSNLNL